MQRNRDTGLAVVVLVVVAVSIVLAVGAGSVFAQDGADDGQNASLNDDRANATPTTANTVVNGTINTSEERWFRFNVSGGNAVRVDPAVAIPISGRITLHTPDGRTEATRSGTEIEPAVGDVPAEDGTYYVQVTNEQAVRAAYGFEVSTASHDEFEPNEGLDSATPVEVNESIDGTLFENDTDWFEVKLGANERIVVDLDRNATQFAPSALRLDVFTANGTRIGEPTPVNEGFYNESINYTVLVYSDLGPPELAQQATAGDAGTYYIRVDNATADQTSFPFEGFSGYELTLNATGESVPTTTPTAQPTTPTTDGPATTTASTATTTTATTATTTTTTTTTTTATTATITERSTTDTPSDTSTAAGGNGKTKLGESTNDTAPGANGKSKTG